MAEAFVLQSLEDERASIWECVDTNGQSVDWNTDPNKCVRGRSPLCGTCTNQNCFALGFDTGRISHVISSSTIPTEIIGKQVTLTFEAATWKYTPLDPDSVYPIRIDVGSASVTYNMVANTTNSTCEGKRITISQTFILPQPGPEGLNFTLWKINNSGLRTCLDIDDVTLSYDPTTTGGIAGVGGLAGSGNSSGVDDLGPSPGSQPSASDTGDTRNTRLAIALGVVAFVLAVIAAGLLFWFCRKKRKTTPVPEQKGQESQEKLTPAVPIVVDVSNPESVGSSTPLTHEDPPSNPVNAAPAPKTQPTLRSSPTEPEPSKALPLSQGDVSDSPGGTPVPVSGGPQSKVDTTTAQDAIVPSDRVPAETTPRIPSQPQVPALKHLPTDQVAESIPIPAPTSTEAEGKVSSIQPKAKEDPGITASKKEPVPSVPPQVPPPLISSTDSPRRKLTTQQHLEEEKIASKPDALPATGVMDPKTKPEDLASSQSSPLSEPAINVSERKNEGSVSLEPSESTTMAQYNVPSAQTERATLAETRQEFSFATSTGSEHFIMGHQVSHHTYRSAYSSTTSTTTTTFSRSSTRGQSSGDQTSVNYLRGMNLFPHSE
ncbi:hypothetical protein M408DRAFT_178821 [Serendipita vermifera MAFF 305830]|uniref:Uncharacterized protein n=1 Tax=Serendipita vermifera MAFF 305830 TaxID=933852 RepID=A0A0C3B5C1_SERVB|nr:hypothetical protein M408DRAFT_178821 [Serendipita vermifera MAFF 305830]